MKLNKKECRKFAVKGLKMPLNSGMLHAEQIEYIVRTAVRIIDHHKILVLYFYSKEQLLHGETGPEWTIFHSRDDYITLERKEDGTTAWRTASFENLNGWGFSSKCAFYTLEDDERVKVFFGKQGKSGFSVLYSAQTDIMRQRTLLRQRKRELATLARMEAISALPRGIDTWLSREIMPAYFFYDYVKGKKAVKGVCSACGKEVEMAGAKHNAKGTCPRCKREVTMKSKGRKGRIFDNEIYQVIQNTGAGEIAVRIFKAYFYYPKDGILPEKSCYETARVFMWQDQNGKMSSESYYHSDKGILTRWKPGDRPKPFGYWYYYYENEKCGHVYCRNLPRALEGTPWQYCPLTDFYEHYHTQMELDCFFRAYLEHPRFEHLIKVGFYQLACDMAYHRTYHNILDETKDRTHQILGVKVEDIPFLRKIEVDWETLETYQKYCSRNLKGRQELILWEKEHKNGIDLENMLEYMTPHKLMRYVEEQQVLLSRKTSGGIGRYSSMQDVLREYRDYLDMCAKQNYDMRNSFVLYPKDLQESHDKETRRLKLKANAKVRRQFKAVYKRIAHQYDFELDGMKIMYPVTPSDLVAEGHALHHCVGRYADSVAKGGCIILFLRNCEDETKPFYTIEINGTRIVQVRGMKNSAPTQKVEKYIKRWEKEVLKAPALAKAA